MKADRGELTTPGQQGIPEAERFIAVTSGRKVKRGNDNDGCKGRDNEFHLNGIPSYG